MDRRTRTILLAAALACLLPLGVGTGRSGATTSKSPAYVLTAWSADCGGTASGSSGAYTLGATLGQPDATGVLVSGPYELVGGLWGATEIPDIAVTAPALEATLCPNQYAPFDVQICNAGTATLEWTTANTLGPKPLPWWDVIPPSGSVAPGGCQTAVVTLGASTPGSYARDLLIDSNDPDTPQVDVPVSLTVVEPLSSADFSWLPVSPAVGEEVTFTETAVGGGTISYAWDLGDNGTATGNPVSHTPTRPRATTW